MASQNQSGPVYFYGTMENNGAIMRYHRNNNTTTQVGVTLDVYQQLQEKLTTTEDLALEYQNTLREHDLLEEEVTPEELMRQQAEEMKKTTKLTEDMFALVQTMSNELSNVKQDLNNVKQQVNAVKEVGNDIKPTAPARKSSK